MADKREIVLDLLARDKSGPAVKAFGKGLDDVGDKADKAGRQAKDFGEKSAVAAKGADALGDQADQTARELGKLDRDIAKTTAELVVLARAFANTDDAAEKLDISKSIRKAQNDLRRTNTSKGIIESIIPDGPSFGAKLKDSINSGLAAVGSLKGGAAIIGAALAPTIGAAISGAVIGGVGLGGVIGGLALVSKDQKLQAEASKIGVKFTKSVNDSAKSAFLVPAAEALAKVGDLAERSAPKIGKIFAATAPSVDGLTDSLTHASDAILDGLVSAAEASAPVMKVLGDIVADTGDSLGGFLEMAASHADEGASALEDLNTAIQSTISVATTVIDVLGDFKGALDGVDSWVDGVRYSLEDQVSWLDLTADGYSKNSQAAKDYRAGLIGAADGLGEFSYHVKGATDYSFALADAAIKVAEASREEAQSITGVTNAVRAQTDPVFALLDAQNNLTTAQDRVADATKKHGKNSREAKAALRDLAQAAIDLQGKAGALGATFDGKVTPELRKTLKAAGLTDDQIRQLGKQFADAKKRGDAFAKKYPASASVSGTEAAKSKVNGLAKALNSLHSVSVGVHIGVSGGAAVAAAAKQLASIQRRATGGPVSKSVPYWVGEEGPELIIPDNHGRVLTAAASRRLMPRGGGMGGPTGYGADFPSSTGQIKKVQLELLGQTEIVTAFRYLIRSANLLQDA